MSNSTKINLIRDINGFVTYGIETAYNKVSALIATTDDESFTVPSNYPYWLAIFSLPAGSEVWVSINNNAAAPSSGFSATDSELNPAVRYLKAGDVVNLLNPTANSVRVGVSLYVAPPFSN
jgi:hypothetical protein